MAKRKIRELTTGVHDFPTLIKGNNTKYVDKTDLLYALCNDADQQLFISRPRRFGKSLMLSTLKAMFEGRKELFTGLKIYDMPWECWDTPHPVYSLTMASANGDTYEEVKEQLDVLVDDLFGVAGIPPPKRGNVPGRFENFLKAAAEKSPTGKIVLLVDEYDEPVAGFLDDLETLKRVRKLLHDFYEKLKTNSGTIRFLMLTGVTKLTKLSVFSGLNHLTDLSMDPRFATLLGCTPEELDGTLRENVEAFGAKRGWDFATARAKLLEWYDGYRFSPESEAKVCNPVSLGKALKTGELLNYWESTGQTTMIVNRLKAADEMPADMNAMAATRTQLDVCQAETMPLPALMYQGGYLTLKEVIDGVKRTAHGDAPDVLHLVIRRVGIAAKKIETVADRLDAVFLVGKLPDRQTVRGSRLGRADVDVEWISCRIITIFAHHFRLLSERFAEMINEFFNRILLNAVGLLRQNNVGTISAIRKHGDISQRVPSKCKQDKNRRACHRPSFLHSFCLLAHKLVVFKPFLA